MTSELASCTGETERVLGSGVFVDVSTRQQKRRTITRAGEWELQSDFARFDMWYLDVGCEMVLLQNRPLMLVIWSLSGFVTCGVLRVCDVSCKGERPSDDLASIDRKA